MKQDINGIDHLVFSTRDLASAHDRLVALGFTLTPRGFHTRLNTMNHTAMFRNGNYIELLGIVKSTPENQMFERPIARRSEALSVIVPKTPSPKELYQRFHASQFAARPPVEFARLVKTA